MRLSAPGRVPVSGAPSLGVNRSKHEHRAFYQGVWVRIELLCCQGRLAEVLDHLAVDDVGEVPLEAPDAVEPRLSLGPLAIEVALSPWIHSGLDQRDGVQGPVQLSVTTAVQTVPVGLARGGGMGAAPHAMAKPAIERNLLASPVSPSSLAAVIAPTPTMEVRCVSRCWMADSIRSVRTATSAPISSSLPRRRRARWARTPGTARRSLAACSRCPFVVSRRTLAL